MKAQTLASGVRVTESPVAGVVWRDYSTDNLWGFVQVSITPHVSGHGYNKLSRLYGLGATARQLSVVLQNEGIAGKVYKRDGRLMYHPFSTDGTTDFDCPLPCYIEQNDSYTLKAIPI